MPQTATNEDALAAIAAELSANGIDDASADPMAEGILSGLVIGYGMDETAFIAVHGPRLAHLTRLALKAAGRPVAAQPGEAPRNI